MDGPNWDAIIALFIPNLVGILSGIACIGQISNKDGTAWWQVIQKPSWVIAEWLFGPLGALKDTTFGYASYLVYTTLKVQGSDEMLPVLLYAAILFFNIATCFTVYKYHKYSVAFSIILLVGALLIALTIIFYQINPSSIIFLIPIQCWHVYILFLTYAVWVLNTPKQEEDYQHLKV